MTKRGLFRRSKLVNLRIEIPKKQDRKAIHMNIYQINLKISIKKIFAIQILIQISNQNRIRNFNLYIFRNKKPSGNQQSQKNIISDKIIFLNSANNLIQKM